LNQYLYLFVRNHDVLKRRRQRVQFAPAEARIAEHALQFAERISVPTVGAAQHHQTELRGNSGRDAILIGNKLQRHGAAVIVQRRMHFAQQALASWWIEVMQEVGQENEIVAGAKLNVEGAAGN